METLLRVDDRELLRALDALDSRTARPAADPVLGRGMSRAADAYSAFLRRRFRANGAGSWAPLADSTRRGKSRKGTAAKGTLRGDSDRLYSSLDPSSPDHLRRLTPDGIQVASAVPYLIHHQIGTDIMSAREVFVPPDATAQAEVDGELEAAVGELVASIFGEGATRGRGN
jgi:hypothetical protein